MDTTVQWVRILISFMVRLKSTFRSKIVDCHTKISLQPEANTNTKYG